MTPVFCTLRSIYKRGLISNRQSEISEKMDNAVKFRCPFTLKECKTETEVMGNVKEWAKKFEIIKTAEDEAVFDRDRIPLFGTSSYPELEGTRLFAAALFIYWFYVYDDICEDAAETSNLDKLAEISQRFADIMIHTPEMKEVSTPLERSFVDFIQLCRRLTNEEWISNFRESWLELNEAIHRERELKENHETPSLREYVTKQIHTCGDLVMFDMLELGYDVYLPVNVHNNEVLKKMIECGAKILRFSNDVFSYEKERISGSGNNLVAVLIAEYGIGKGEALDKAIEMYNEQISEFMRLEQQLPIFG